MTFLLANWRILGITAIIALFGFFLWHYDNLSDRAAEADMLEDELRAVVVAQEKANATLLKYEQDLFHERKRTAELTKELADEVSTNPVYASCVVPASGVLLYNRALKASSESNK